VAKAALFSAMALSTMTGGASVASAQQSMPSASGGETSNGQQGDPNMPGYTNIIGQKIRWIYDSGFGNAPLVHFLDASVASSTGRPPAYMGWNQKGSWFKNDDGRIVVWNLKQDSLTVRYTSDRDIPPEEISAMKNFQGQFNYLLAKGNMSAKPASGQPDIVGATIAANHNDPRAELKKTLFGDPQSVRAAVGGVQGGATPTGAHAPVFAGDITGTGAAIEGGVLTFTLPDRSTATHNVVRPKVMQGNPQSAADIRGSWIAMEGNGKGILFTVMGDNTVTGKEMPAEVIQMLMQGPKQ